MHSGDETVVTGDPIALDDLRQILKGLGNFLKLAGDRPNPQISGKRQAKGLRVNLDGITLDHPGLFQSFDTLGDARR